MSARINHKKTDESGITQYIEATPEALNYAHELLVNSASDIEASRLLKDQGLNALAVFHLQQAVEKAMKALLLINGLYTEKQVRKFSHNSFSAFVDQWEKIESIEISPSFISASTLSLKNQAQMAKDNPEKIMKLRHGGICQMLDAVDSRLPMYIQKVREQTLGGPESDFLAYGHYKSIFELSIMGLLTFQHESCTRYPDGILKPSDYSDQLGIVMALPDLLNRLDYIVAFLDYTAVLH